jgi:glycosyltransferase involved in cell wall biosynthesis
MNEELTRLLNKKISVIIPVYGTEKYLEKCILSVVNQTYTNLEIIIVNDCSPDNSQFIINEYIKKDSRIKCVRLSKNMGLYHARLAGFDEAGGDYIAFLDSDDHVGIDAYRSMISKAEQTQSDIVFGNVVIEWEANGNRTIHSYNQPFFDELNGSEITQSFLGQEGYTFFWYAAWNKLYKKETFDKARPYFNRIDQHTIMAEDVAFCAVLLAMADRVTHIDYHTSYYLQSSTSSTSRSTKQSKYIKSVQDMCRVMDFIEEFVNEHPSYRDCIDKFKRFKEIFVLYWVTSIQTSKLSKKNKDYCWKALKEAAGIEEFPNHKRIGERSLTYDEDRSFIYCQSVPFDNGYEKVLKRVADNSNKAVIFPLKDVLFNRNYIDDSDLFWFLKISYGLRYDEKSAVSWIEIRKACESGSGTIIDDVYEKMCEAGIGKETCEVLKSLETELILHLYTRRESIKQIFDLANHQGKRVIVIADYLNEATVKQMLFEYGYDACEHIIAKENMKQLYGELHLSEKDIVWFSAEKGSDIKFIISYPRPVGVLLGKCGAFDYLRQSSAYQDAFFGNMYNKSSVVVAANEYFDNPFLPFNDETDFNKEAYFMGLFPVAIFALNVAKWLSEFTEYETILFDEQTGGIVKRVFERYVELTGKSISTASVSAVQNEQTARLMAVFCIADREAWQDTNVLSIFGGKRGAGGDCLYPRRETDLSSVVEYLLGKLTEREQVYYSEKLIRKSIDKGVSDFTDRMFDLFSEYLGIMKPDYSTSSLLMDYLLYNSKFEDISLFDYCSIFIDEGYGEYEKSLLQYWIKKRYSVDELDTEKEQESIAFYPFLYGKSRVRKLFFYLFFDNKTLVQKLKVRYGTNKRMFKLLKFVNKYLFRKYYGF